MIFTPKRNINFNRDVVMNKVVIERKTEARLLGVIVDDKLTWSKHIIQVVRSKINNYIGIMYKLKYSILLQARLLMIISKLCTVTSEFLFLSMSGFLCKPNIDRILTVLKKPYEP